MDLSKEGQNLDAIFCRQASCDNRENVGPLLSLPFNDADKIIDTADTI